MDSLSSPASTLHMAMAALVGASIMAVSAFYIHKRSVNHAVHRLIDQYRNNGGNSSFASIAEDEFSDSDGLMREEDQEMDDDDETEFDSDGDEISGRRIGGGGFSRSVDENLRRSIRMSSSLPNVAFGARGWGEGDGNSVRSSNPRAREASSSSLDKLDNIPIGLSPLRTENRHASDLAVDRAASYRRVASVDRLVTPIAQGGSAFDIAGDSDDEGTELNGDDDEFYDYAELEAPVSSVNGHEVNSSIQNSSAVPLIGNDRNYTEDQTFTITANEAQTGVDRQGDGKGFPAPGHFDDQDHSFSSLILPLCRSSHDSTNKEDEEVCKMLRECLDLRKRYVFREELSPSKMSASTDSNPSDIKGDLFHFGSVEASDHVFRMEDGIAHVYAKGNETEKLFPVADATTFFTDMHFLLKVMSIGNIRTTCYNRLRFLEEKFRLHLLINSDKEFLAQKSAPHRDFYNIRKVDTHIHHSACMNQKHLLRFIKSKLRTEPDEVVIFRDGKYLTVREVFESLDLTGHDLNVDLLDVHADKSTFHRFDKFNLKYNPCGQSRLREIFLKQDNLIQGRFLAEMTKEVLLDLEASKYQMAEYRISIYGRKQSEWDQLASWVVNNEIYSENAVWLIQLPRLYNIYKKMGIVTSFQNILDNVFIPLFEVTIDPNSHPQLHMFLKQVVGFDLVDDESKPERRPTKHMPTPAEWTNEFNPAFSYYTYYCYANLYILNKLRESKGMTIIKLRPHCGEAGDVDHLIAGFLLCHNISHGITLRKSPVLQYLYYLAQVGLAMSPLSNNSLFLDYHRNPFPVYFQRGLNVSLSSDDPLQIHLTKEALVEEYSVAAKVWKLSACDLCEIARNSVYQSGFSHSTKLHWHGSKYYLRGPEGNDIHKTNVPRLRIAFRHETWKEEMQYVYSGKAMFPEEVEL